MVWRTASSKVFFRTTCVCFTEVIFLDDNSTDFFIGGTKVRIVNPKDEPNRDEVEKILSSIALLYRNTLQNPEQRKGKQG